jgi:hypothetical protein
VATDPRRLRPTELCRLLNSTPLGEVINQRQLQRHRVRAGQRIGDDQHVDLLRYVAWLVQVRHVPKPQQTAPPVALDLAEAALGAARLACSQEQVKGHGQKFTRRHEALIAALLTEPTHAKAAAKAGICEATLYRWLELPEFLAAYRRACRVLVEAPLGRLQAAVGQAVDSLVDVARNARRDSDRTRASIAVLDFALTKADGMQSTPNQADAPLLGTADVVKVLSVRLRQIEESELPMTEKTRLTAALTDALLRAINVDVLDKRLEALENVLLKRKDSNQQA